MKRVILRRHKEKALQRGYPWVFANQIHRIHGDPAGGDVVEIASADGQVLGLGLYHATSLIAVRFLTSDATATIDAAFFRERLRRALALREAAFPGATHYRLAFGESDGLPGTVIDRYGDVLVWSTLSLGMEQRRDLLLDALEDLLHPTAIVERNDVPLRAKDGLAETKGVLRGRYEGPVEIEEHGVRYAVDVLDGPKTGFFIDQRLHRAAVRPFARDRRVLDVFSADGGFGLQCAAAGAASVHLLDVSQAALDRAVANATRNGLADRLTTEQADALDRLGRLVEEGASYDFVILDPPAFAKSRRHVEEATRAYQRINISALQLLPPGGLLATASCSQAIGEGDFVKIIQYSARKAGARLRLLYRGTQPPDHPVLDTMPETHYLKFYLFQKLYDEVP
ncbi:class I SAM-dependent rRNA methyltransferase [Rhodocaloribacter litoris]|uniref:class I SAM-dependent rRNA methyltransferase n=1 Tax=Rhodocaloribacter litoris TaxID=2558931 RepID=UPI00141FA29E|nr:class I SAM-dependent rRNA methyltransferase [Rhodocaloribacter litoris]QXD15753.1 class I SAM-dependent rRNA methyltransferase [Rhodocaloribacter litoris]GIV60253.1 MAG: SAM-dependent methyltransferase [Rhodothermaceae bacterium]